MKKLTKLQHETMIHLAQQIKIQEVDFLPLANVNMKSFYALKRKGFIVAKTIGGSTFTDKGIEYCNKNFDTFFGQWWERNQ
jgi:hypothetical protein